ncbi:MAG TPA: glycosyltransferase family 4 protein [Terriglobia bacterium]|jgi:glycosyltransferase involved in cell wall biosynthesis|nr:glycosyltransferase family 4 protein [Terriglobia bacterium]
MKVLLVHNEYQQPGGEDAVFRLERDLLKSFGHNVVSYVRTNHEISRHSEIGRISLLKQTIWAEDSRRGIAAILTEVRPDVVHVHNTFTRISPSIYAECRRFEVPVVQTLHNFRLLCPAATFYRSGSVCEDCLNGGLWNSVFHGCYRKSRSATAAVAAMLMMHRRLHTWDSGISRFIALTEFARKKFICGGFAPESITVKPNFVAPDPHTGDGNREYALFVGRLSEEKGLRTLLRAWTQLRNTVPLRIVGDGPMGFELKNYSVANALDSVRFEGRVDHSETQEIMKSARFLILPSECYENFPMTIVEAFASGTPVICSRLGAMQEIVEHHVTGLHFEPGNSESLAECAAWAWTHPAQMRAMGTVARREYELKYTAERNYSLLMEIYQRAIRKPELSGIPDGMPESIASAIQS